MKQISLASTGFELSVKRTRRREFLDEMDRVIPWAELVALIEPHAPSGRKGRPPFPVEAMLRIYVLQLCYNHSDPAMEEALHDIPLYRDFARLDAGMTRLPDESTILRFRHLLEAQRLGEAIFQRINTHLEQCGLLLKQGSVIDATLVAAPSSTKNSTGQRDPEMHQTKKGNQWHFGMKAHVGVDADSGLVHTVVGTAANVHDVTQAAALLHGQEQAVYADAGYRGVDKRPEVAQAHPGLRWQVAMRPSQRRALNKQTPLGALLDQIERAKASIRSKVEHVFRILKCQFGYRKTRYRGLYKNTHQITVMLALGNLWMVRKRMP